MVLGATAITALQLDALHVLVSLLLCSATLLTCTVTRLFVVQVLCVSLLAFQYSEYSKYSTVSTVMGNQCAKAVCDACAFVQASVAGGRQPHDIKCTRLCFSRPTLLNTNIVSLHQFNQFVCFLYFKPWESETTTREPHLVSPVLVCQSSITTFLQQQLCLQLCLLTVFCKQGFRGGPTNQTSRFVRFLLR